MRPFLPSISTPSVSPARAVPVERVALLVLLLALLAAAPVAAQPCDPLPPKPEAAGPAAEAADTTAWARHAEQIRAYRLCATSAPANLVTAEAKAWMHAHRFSAVVELAETVLRGHARSDSAAVSRVYELAGVSASRIGRPDESTHLFRTSGYYAAARSTEERSWLRVKWAEGAIRAGRYQHARRHLREAESVADEAADPSVTPATIASLQAWTYVLEAVRDEQPVSDSLDALLNRAEIALYAGGKQIVEYPLGNSIQDVAARTAVTRAAAQMLRGEDRAVDRLAPIRGEAEARGDAWAVIAAGYVEALGHARTDRPSRAYAIIDQIARLSRDEQEPVLLPNLLLTQVRVACRYEHEEQARDGVRQLSELSGVPPKIFEMASSRVIDTFNRPWTWTTWGQIFGLVLILSLAFQFVVARLRSGDAITDVLPSETEEREPTVAGDNQDIDEYRSPQGLNTPVINDHATIAFDVQIDLDPEEIDRIIRSTPFTDPGASADATADGAGDGPPVAGDTPRPRTDIPDPADSPGSPGTVSVPCYGADGTQSADIEIPIGIADSLARRKIIALEVDGELLLLYRFEGGAQQVLHYDPENDTFESLDLDERFHGFPIARLGGPGTDSGD